MSVSTAIHRPVNRLWQETSPYLRQHAHNPVDWYPWGPEAIEKARLDDKPLFLSIGYSACHWCHVMERESFENEDIAAFMNAHFVNIKVDREERPDVDEIYMAAVMAMTGNGGWPMSVFLTPDLQPFYGGTYFPPADYYGYPGFPSVLRGVVAAWQNRREETLQTAQALTAYVRTVVTPRSDPGGVLGPHLMVGAAVLLRNTYDAAHGGWGGAPKFPSSGGISVLLREYRRTRDVKLLQMATSTLDAMARGGIYDHLGGGFHRYSVDAQWHVPHFEKMLYDNAQLAQVYIEAFQVTGQSFYRRVARETLDYVLRDMQDPDGGFYSSEDADSEGEEGRFYLWTKAEICRILGTESAQDFCAWYGVREEGNFESHESYHAGLNILYVPKDLRVHTGEDVLRLSSQRTMLLIARSSRTRPGRDEKILTAWNAMMISALAQGAQAFSEPRYREAAERAAGYVIKHLRAGDALLHAARGDAEPIYGYLDDYALTISAWLDLYETTFDLHWITQAQDLGRTMIEQFWDARDGGFFFTGSHHAHLIARSKPSYDGAEPSGNSAAALSLARLAHYTGEEKFESAARHTLERYVQDMEKSPLAYLKMLLAADYLVHGPYEIVLAGGRGDTALEALLHTLHRTFVPNKTVRLASSETNAGEELNRLYQLSEKHMVQGKATAYVCREGTCGPPLLTTEALLRTLEE